jgi:gas vesicle protein
MTESSSNSQRNQPNFLNGFFWGTLVGGISIFLFGTESGKRLKKFLNEHGEQILDELEKTYGKVNKQQNILKKLTVAKPIRKSSKTDTKKPEKQESTKLLESTKQDLSHIQKLQERGRTAAQRFFTRKGRSLK